MAVASGRKRVGLRGVALCLAALVVVMALAVSSSGAAKTKKVSTGAGELFVDADSVSGAIKSNSDCRGKRKVKLRIASGDKVIASTQTTKKGEWEITKQLGVGSYYAQIPKVSRTTGKGAKLSCGAAKTKTVTL